MIFQSLQDIHFYNIHASCYGFVIWVFSHKKDKDGVIVFKSIVHNVEGFKGDRHAKRNHNHYRKANDIVVFGEQKQRRPFTRVGCNARIVFKCNKNRKYLVFHFIDAHLHALATPSPWTHLKTSMNISLVHKKFIVENNRANQGLIGSF